MNTREQILEAAWELYGARGFENVSVRDVTHAAGVNLASISYHFGGKEGLIQETVKRCMNPINSYRLQLLDQAITEHNGVENVPLTRVLEALMRPLVMPEECGVQTGLMLRLVARYLIESDYSIPSASRELYTEALQAFVRALLLHYPQLTPATVVKQMVFASGAVVHYHGLGRLALKLSSGHEQDVCETDREQMLRDVIGFTVHGFGGDGAGASVS